MAKFDFSKVYDSSITGVKDSGIKNMSDEEVINLYSNLFKAFSESNIKDIMKDTAGLDYPGSDKKNLFAAGILAITNRMAKIKKKAMDEKTPDAERNELQKKLEGMTIISAKTIKDYSMNEHVGVAEAFQAGVKGELVGNVQQATDYNKNIINEYANKKIKVADFQCDVLTNIISQLKYCESAFRGSSREFEDILNTAKRMQKSFEKNIKDMSEYTRYYASQKCAEALIIKMNGYIAERSKLIIDNNADTKAYKARRAYTMLKLRNNLLQYMDKTEKDVKLSREKYISVATKSAVMSADAIINSPKAKEFLQKATAGMTVEERNKYTAEYAEKVNKKMATKIMRTLNKPLGKFFTAAFDKSDFDVDYYKNLYDITPFEANTLKEITEHEKLTCHQAKYILGKIR